MKLVFSVILISFFFFSGCVVINDNSQDDPIVPTPNNGGTNGGTSNGGTSNNGGLVNDNFPSITTSVSPSNPDRKEIFTVTVSGEDDVGIQSISWDSPDSFLVLPDIGAFDCGLQKTCSVSWEFSSGTDGMKTITVYVTDSVGQESGKVPLEINVLPFDFVVPTSAVCGNNDCEVSKGETDSTCPADCASGAGSDTSVCGDGVCADDEAYEICSSDCPRIDAVCGNGVCEGGESYTTNCTADCVYADRIGTQNNDGACEPGEDIERNPGDCTDIRPNCGNDVCDSWETRDSCYADCKGISGGSGDACNSDSECGYKEACKSGVCRDVDCTNDAQCGSHKECESNRCVYCPYGALGIRTC